MIYKFNGCMTQLFVHDNLIVGILVLIIGFGFHWIGQLVSVLNWEYATKIGIQEEGMLPEYKVYEHAIAKADVAMGWVYGIAGLGLIQDADWGYTLAWVPGVVLVYHGISFWFWTGNQRNQGHNLASSSMRIGWTLANTITGLLAIAIAWVST